MRRDDKFLVSRVGPDAGQPGLPCQPSPEMPRGFSSKKFSPFHFRQFGDPFQIHLNTGFERFPGFLKGVAFNSDIKVSTNCLPAVTAAVSVAL